MIARIALGRRTTSKPPSRNSDTVPWYRSAVESEGRTSGSTG